MRVGRMKNCRALKVLEHYTTPRQGRVFAWIIEILINTLVVISALPVLMGFPESMDWVQDYNIQYITLGLISANLLTEFLTSPVTYADKKRPFLNFVTNPMNWLEVIAIIGLSIPTGDGAWAAIAFLRLFKFIYLIGNNSTILIARHVTVKYGSILLEIVVISSAVLFMLSTGVLAMELADPNVDAFGGPDIENIWDAFYYTFIASSTIGFGDISPLTFGAQIYTMFLAVYGIVIIALISSVFVAGFTDGAKKLTKIKAETRRQKVRIFEKMVDVERKIKINRTIDSLNHIIAKTKLNVKPITHVDIIKDVKMLRYLQKEGQEKTKEVDIDDIIAQAGQNIKRDANKDKYNEMEYIVQNAIQKSLGNVKSDGSDRCHVGEKIKHRDIKAYCGVDGTVKEWSLNNSLRSGHWTLAVFFPVGFDDTSDEELKDLKENIEMFKNAEVDLLAITSQDMNTNRLWIDESFHGLPFGIASDKQGFYGKRFGFWDEAKNKNTRGSVVIDDKGVIQGIVSVGQDVARTAEDLFMFANSIKERTNKNK